MRELIGQYEYTHNNRIKLLRWYKTKGKFINKKVREKINSILEENESISEFIHDLLKGKLEIADINEKTYWARSMCELCIEEEDKQGLIEVINEPSLSQAHTAARKALRVIDFVYYGPKVS